MFSMSALKMQRLYDIDLYVEIGENLKYSSNENILSSENAPSGAVLAKDSCNSINREIH